jgi:CTP synthase (UTP-ammonia lyase)
LDVLTDLDHDRPMPRSDTPSSSAPQPRLALVGDRSAAVRAHERIPTVLRCLDSGEAEPIDAYWIHSTMLEGGRDADSALDLAAFDGIWVIPGSPYEHPAGVLEAVRSARTGGIPLLGTCGGFQHLVLEYARNVCGLASAVHGEEHPEADEQLLVALACSLMGEEASVTVEAGTRAAEAMGAGTRTERYFCAYGINPSYLDRLVEGGLVVSGRDADGSPRVVELPEHPFYLGTLFQPELSSDRTWVHPVIRAFADAVRDHAARRTAAPASATAAIAG